MEPETVEWFGNRRWFPHSPSPWYFICRWKGAGFCLVQLQWVDCLCLQEVSQLLPRHYNQISTLRCEERQNGFLLWFRHSTQEKSLSYQMSPLGLSEAVTDNLFPTWMLRLHWLHWSHGFGFIFSQTTWRVSYFPLQHLSVSHALRLSCNFFCGSQHPTLSLFQIMSVFCRPFWLYRTQIWSF